MTTITIPRALLEQALNVLNSFELQDGRLWYSKLEPEQIDVTCSVIRAELAKPMEQVEPAAWGMPDANRNVVDVITDLDKCEGMKKWGEQYSVPLYLHPPAPAWHDAPTEPGLWVNSISGRVNVVIAETLHAWQNTAARWYGPICEDAAIVKAKGGAA